MPAFRSATESALRPRCLPGPDTPPAQRRALAATLSAALNEDPFWRWLCPIPGDETRLRPGIDAQLRRLALPLGRVDHLDGIGAALWSPPGTWRLGTLHQIRMLPLLAAMAGAPCPAAWPAFASCNAITPAGRTGTCRWWAWRPVIRGTVTAAVC